MNTIIFYHLYLSNTVSFQFYKFFMEKIHKNLKFFIFVSFFFFKTLSSYYISLNEFFQLSKDNSINETVFTETLFIYYVCFWVHVSCVSVAAFSFFFFFFFFTRFLPTCGYCSCTVHEQ